MKAAILFPTRQEAQYYTGLRETSPEVHICGIGAVSCAAITARIITSQHPEIIILAGIAGAYRGSGLQIGNTVIVEKENIADMGAMRKEGFIPLPIDGKDTANNCYICDTSIPDIFLKIISNTVNVAGTPYLDPEVASAQIENMEGAAFFAVCRALGTPFIEIRTISNFVGDGKDKWDIPLAANNLAVSLRELCETL